MQAHRGKTHRHSVPLSHLASLTVSFRNSERSGPAYAATRVPYTELIGAARPFLGVFMAWSSHALNGTRSKSLTWILDSVRQLVNAETTSGPRSRLERHNRFVDEVME
jgi:hypothetical protein